jgi:hypothetical protein
VGCSHEAELVGHGQPHNGGDLGALGWRRPHTQRLQGLHHQRLGLQGEPAPSILYIASKNRILGPIFRILPGTPSQAGSHAQGPRAPPGGGGGGGGATCFANTRIIAPILSAWTSCGVGAPEVLREITDWPSGRGWIRQDRRRLPRGIGIWGSASELVLSIPRFGSVLTRAAPPIAAQDGKLVRSRAGSIYTAGRQAGPHAQGPVLSVLQDDKLVRTLKGRFYLCCRTTSWSARSRAGSVYTAGWQAGPHAQGPRALGQHACAVLGARAARRGSRPHGARARRPAGGAAG